MDKAVITGSFADYRRVKTRSVMQLIIEVPIEKGIEAVRVLGEPIPGTEIPVAIARMASTVSAPSAPSKNYPGAAKMLAKNTIFKTYILEVFGLAYDEAAAERFIESHCEVSSCSEIVDGTDAGKKFAILYAKFKEWQENK